MKKIKNLFVIISILPYVNGFGQKITPAVKEKHTTVRQLTIEPGIGIHTNFGTDFLISNLIQWNPKKRLALASHSSFNINNRINGLVRKPLLRNMAVVALSLLFLIIYLKLFLRTPAY